MREKREKKYGSFSNEPVLEDEYGSFANEPVFDRFKRTSFRSTRSLTDPDHHPKFQAELKERRPRKSRLHSFLGSSEHHKNLIDFELSSFEVLEEYASLEDIDAAIDLIATDQEHDCRSSAIREVRPNRLWLWKQWKGTIMVSEGLNCMIIMGIAVVLSCLVPMVEEESPWNIHVEKTLAAILSLWTYMLTLTTFVLTFYIQQSYEFWWKIYTAFRGVQGCLNELSMLFATHAARKEGTMEYTPEAMLLLKDIAAANRLFSVFTYATQSRRYHILHTDRALKRMVERGVIPPKIYKSLIELEIHPGARCYTMLELIIIKFQEGSKKKILLGGVGFEQVGLNSCCQLLGHFTTFGDLLDARIPLAYAHLMQVLIDTLLLLAPFALYSEMNALCIPAVGVISFFFSGLLNLSKVFYDPMDNEDYYDDMMEINVGVFVRESNGLSKEFQNAVEVLPEGWVS